MRKLVTIRVIDEIRPIENADAIVCAVVDGWEVVVRKDEYNEGDKVVFCEIDSWIPTTLAPFLTSKGHFPRTFNGVEGERLKTVKLRGQISQGLILPLEVLGQCGISYTDTDEDLAPRMGIQKWEKPMSPKLAGMAKGNFPAFIPKTDQERVQNLAKKLPLLTLEPNIFEATEKLEGTSMTVYRNDGYNGVCSRNLDLKQSEGNLYWEVALRECIHQKLEAHEVDNVAIQGELIGPGIQGNIYNLDRHEFRVFDVIALDGPGKHEYLKPWAREAFCDAMGLEQVPVVFNDVTLFGVDLQGILALAEGKSVLNLKTEREGLVFRNVSNGSISFKVISNRYLIKSES